MQHVNIIYKINLCEMLFASYSYTYIVLENTQVLARNIK